MLAMYSLTYSRVYKLCYGTDLRTKGSVPGVHVMLVEVGGRDRRPVLLVAVAHRVHRVHLDRSLH